MSDLDDIKNRIINAMISEGTYNPNLDLYIEICADTCAAFKKVSSDVLGKRTKSFVKEITREDNEKLASHPSYKIFPSFSDAASKRLGELGLAPKDISPKKEDEVGELVNDVNEADNEQ